MRVRARPETRARRTPNRRPVRRSCRPSSGSLPFGATLRQRDATEAAAGDALGTDPDHAQALTFGPVVTERLDGRVDVGPAPELLGGPECHHAPTLGFVVDLERDVRVQHCR